MLSFVLFKKNIMRNFLTAKWENIIMANYPVDQDMLKPYLPHGVELDLYKGKAYVSLVGFMFKNTKLFNIPILGLGTFEEVNLRFYVTRKEGNVVKRGVVFINETVPYKIVAWIANILYKEHYTVIPTSHKITLHDNIKKIEYLWKVKNNWNRLSVLAEVKSEPIEIGGFEEFIFDHYYGYTKINNLTTEEYIIEHPQWRTNNILEFDVNCDFEEMYGKKFGFLNISAPSSVMIVDGSFVAVKWKRSRI